MKYKKLLTCSCLILPSVVFAGGKPALSAQPTPEPPTIDGLVDDAWQQADTLEVRVDEKPYEPNNGYEGILDTTVTIQALYDDEHLYMKFEWDDPTESLARFPWEKQADGSWKQLKNLDSTGHENTYYEDKLAVLWNINERGFQKKGCDRSCHVAEDGKVDGIADTSSGRHFTRSGVLDEWQWKADRTNPVGQLSDGSVDSEKNTRPNWGRNKDSLTGGNYYNNHSEENPNQPAWMSEATAAAAGTNPIYHLLTEEKIPFKDIFQAGDRLPGIVAAAATGGIADVSAKGVWQDGRWTLEIKRKLVTDATGDRPEDLQFDDLGKRYYFGVSVFDNAQIVHIHHTGSIELTFAQ